MLLVAQLHPTLCDPVDCSLCSWDSPGRNAGVGCHFLLRRIFPTQGSNPDLPHCRQILYHLSHQGSPKRILGWVAISSSRETHCQPQTNWGARSSPADAHFLRDLSWFQYLTFWVIALHTVNSCSYCFKFTSKEWAQEILGPQHPKLNVFLFLRF